ncbi:MAG: 6,7-dimethyl-8-ribityllumazine synthase, partial [Burkholderiales bacterium]|nr:6,7-dimethyl-8-ribityllumazine synthase [Burkholderiales bacterium]
MQDADRGNAASLDGDGLAIGIVQARFNAALTDKLADACRAELLALGVAAKHITHVTVPGALEIAVA